MKFLNLFKSLFFNEEIKSIMPLIVSLIFFFIMRNFFIILINKKKVNRVLINLLSFIITGIAYFAFIEILDLARYTYIFDAIPFIFYWISLSLACFREISVVLYVFISSSVLKMSVYHLFNDCVTFILYDAIKCFIFRFKIKIGIYLKHFLTAIQLIIYRDIEIYKINCSFSC